MSAAFDALRPALQAAATDLRLNLSATQADALLGHLSLLAKWNGTYNLTSVREPAQMLVQHIVDCLAAIGPLRAQIGSDAHRLLDVGSGGGLPGVVIAILIPDAEVTCIDTVGKKAAFIRQVAGELQLRNLHAVHARVERLALPRFDVVCSRAFASLADFVRLTRPLLSDTGLWMAMKGKPPDDEVRELPSDVDVFHVEPLAVPGLSAERCLVWMRERRQGSAEGTSL